MSQQKPEQGHDEQGRFTTVYHDEDIIDILDDAEPTGTGTRDVADTLGCSLVHASRRLNELVEEGRVDVGKSAERACGDSRTLRRNRKPATRRTLARVIETT